MARPPKLPIPERALNDVGAILGRTGAGKSGTGRILLEHKLRAGHRAGVIDPKGDWWGARLAKSGKSPSPFKVIVFGGTHADVPITDDNGHVLGQVLAGSSESFIIDLSGFSIAGMRRFMMAFAESFFEHNLAPITLFVDEADQLAPQRVGADMANLLHRMERLARQGRSKGIFLWMLTQRPAVLNKNLLSQAETLVAMKVTTVHDRKALSEWMQAHSPEDAAIVEKDLAKLSVGEAFVWVPSADFLQRMQFPLFQTYDSGRTPQHGETVEDVKLKPLDVGEFGKLLAQEDAATDELAETKAALKTAQTALADERARHRETRAELASVNMREDRLLTVFAALQMRIGAAIGSPAIEPLGLDKPYEKFVMIEDSDGVVRAIPREGDNPNHSRKAKARVKRANPKKDAK